MNRKYGLIGAGIAVIILLLWWAGIGEVIEILRTARLDYFLLAIAVYVASLVTWALRWQVLMKSLNIRPKFREVLGALLVGVFINNVTPGARGGGEPVRAYYVHKRTGDPYGPVFATVMMDRILDVIPVVFMLVLATVHVYRLGSITLTVTLILLDAFFAVLTFATVGVLLSERKTKRILYWLYRQFRRITPKRAAKYEERFVRAVEVSVPQFQENFRMLMRHKKAFAISLTWSFVTWTLILLRSCYIFYSINSPIRLVDVMVVQMIGIVVGMVSVVPGGAGLIELINSTVYVLLGINKEIAVTATILERLISYWAPTVIGAVIMTHFGIKVSEGDVGDSNINDSAEEMG
ncbi:lysylphosphatidylglycerol synthase transmembrane domain-containing protein [Thermococcus sp.]|uniref:lysylphosphatidylglycerol synthase transmembrane domain-containing protein n=1 Tax=Thermococcus sp. TaxID=35749 RepID=UPI0026220921|nr:lysylphosphatidylglycerol synthase transmembrane domain-containing protein [Thermococcus sp.]